MSEKIGIEDLITACCHAPFIRKGRANYICSKCNADVSMMFVFMVDSFVEGEKPQEFKLTLKCIHSKRGKNGKSNSYYCFFLNGVKILKQKMPWENNYDQGHQHHTGLDDVYLENNRLYQLRTKFDKSRIVSFPVSKSLLKKIGLPSTTRVELKHN